LLLGELFPVSFSKISHSCQNKLHNIASSTLLFSFYGSVAWQVWGISAIDRTVAHKILTGVSYQINYVWRKQNDTLWVVLL